MWQAIAITVEDKDDIEKFKDYKPQKSGGAAPQAPPPSTPAKEEVVEKSTSPPEPKPVKPSAAPETDRVFASPLARKLAEDNNVFNLIYFSITEFCCKLEFSKDIFLFLVHFVLMVFFC